MKKKGMIITGASKGLGRAAAIWFSKKGFSLALISRFSKNLEQVRKKCFNPNNHICIDLDLLNLKENEIVKKIGVSIYSYLTLDKVLNKYKFDVVQLPFNIFDRRLLTNKYFQKIKNKEIEIHIRSIFLQGLLLRDYKKIPKYFKKWKRIFLSWEKWCEKKNISKLQSCLNFVSSYKKIDKVIIGVADEKELIQILKCIKKVSKNYPKKIFSNDIKLIDPRKWKKT